MVTRKLCRVAAMAFALSGCGGSQHVLFEGGADRAAVLYAEAFTSVRLFSVDYIDGPNRLGFGNDWDGAFEITLEAGPHVVSVGFHDSNWSGSTTTESVTPISIEFTAEPKHRYLVHAEADEETGTWSAAVTDAATLPAKPSNKKTKVKSARR